MEFISELTNNLSKMSGILVLLFGYILAKQEFLFQSMHRKRLEVIAEAYEKIQLAWLAYKKYYVYRKEENGHDFVRKAEDMRVFLHTKRIFFNERESKIIDEIFEKITEIWAKDETGRIVANNVNLLDPAFQAKLIEDIGLLYRDKIPALIQVLEKNFRKAI